MHMMIDIPEQNGEKNQAMSQPKEYGDEKLSENN